MPTLDFKGKQHIYAHHLTVPYRPMEPDADRLQWWHRVAVRQRGDYYLRGWKQDRIWPDFVAMGGETAGKPHVLVFETKGEHLRGNPDTDYKQRALETLQDAFNCGTMTVRNGPARGTFRLVFNESLFPEAKSDVAANR